MALVQNVLPGFSGIECADLRCDGSPGHYACRNGAGVATVLGVDASSYGLTTPQPPENQAAREADQLAAHRDALPAEALPQMVAIQHLWDAVLTRAILRATDETDGPIALITGNGHARKDRGFPTFLSRLRP